MTEQHNFTSVIDGHYIRLNDDVLADTLGLPNDGKCFSLDNKKKATFYHYVPDEAFFSVMVWPGEEFITLH